jgi:hypothetical protein
MYRKNLPLASVFSRKTRNLLGSIVAFQVIDGRLQNTDWRNISRDNLNRPSHLPQIAYRSYILGTIISKQEEINRDFSENQRPM